MAIPALIGAAIVGGLAQAATSLVGRVLLALGISYVSFTGLDALLTNLTGQINANMGGIPAQLAGWLGVLKVQTSISIITSAFSTRMALAAVGGTIKKAVMR